MKLIVQIPCLNEEKTLPVTVRDIPRTVEGVDKVEILIIDDGSTDRTVEVAKELGVDHIVKLTSHKGLAYTFAAGVDACLKRGADIIVNTDGDNQYWGADIAKLIQPILNEKADFVVGARPIEHIEHFSALKKMLQRVGSWVVRVVSRTDVSDAPSGFRAFSREAALRLNIFSDYTYTLETVIQAGQKNITIASVPIRCNERLRESRLIKNTLRYLWRSFMTIVRIFIVYKPLFLFTCMSVGVLTLGFLIGVRFLYFHFTGVSQGHVQSLILAAILIIVGVQLLMVGLAADVIAANRKLIEDVQYRVRKLELRAKDRYTHEN